MFLRRACWWLPGVWQTLWSNQSTNRDVCLMPIPDWIGAAPDHAARQAERWRGSNAQAFATEGNRSRDWMARLLEPLLGWYDVSVSLASEFLTEHSQEQYALHVRLTLLSELRSLTYGLLATLRQITGTRCGLCSWRMSEATWRTHVLCWGCIDLQRMYLETDGFICGWSSETSSLVLNHSASCAHCATCCQSQSRTLELQIA